MFAKLSALALCLSAVSALQLVVTGTVHVDADFDVAITRTVDDPSEVNLVLYNADISALVVVAEAVVLVDSLVLHVPESVVPHVDYVLRAIDCDDESHIWGESTVFEILAELD